MRSRQQYVVVLQSWTSIEPLIDSFYRAQKTARREALQHNADYRKYIENLRSSGYFRSELEGSRLWTELEDKAAEAFVEVRRDEYVNRLSMRAKMAMAEVFMQLAMQPELLLLVK